MGEGNRGGDLMDGRDGAGKVKLVRGVEGDGLRSVPLKLGLKLQQGLQPDVSCPRNAGSGFDADDLSQTLSDRGRITSPFSTDILRKFYTKRILPRFMVICVLHFCRTSKFWKSYFYQADEVQRSDIRNCNTSY